MQTAGRPAAGSAGQATRSPQLMSILVLSFATCVYFVGYIVIMTGTVLHRTSNVLISGIVVLLAGILLYVAGFVLYRRNSGKPSFVGYVVQAAQQQQQLPQGVHMPYGPAAAYTITTQQFGPVTPYPPAQAETVSSPSDAPPQYEDAEKPVKL